MIDDKKKVRWYIAQYSESTEDLEAEYDINYFDIDAFRIEFENTNSEFPMEGCFPIRWSNIEFLRKYMDQPPVWNFKLSSYFIESQAI